MSSQPPLSSAQNSPPPTGGRGNAAAVLTAVLAAPAAARADSAQAKSALLDAAYDEYCRRRAAGEAVDPDAYCAGYPRYQTSLRRILRAHLWFELNSYVLADRKPAEWPKA